MRKLSETRRTALLGLNRYPIGSGWFPEKEARALLPENPRRIKQLSQQRSRRIEGSIVS